jgi:hypothetical protein
MLSFEINDGNFKVYILYFFNPFDFLITPQVKKIRPNAIFDISGVFHWALWMSDKQKRP